MQNKESAFLEALARFEQSLETPVIPGELPTWLTTARNACDDVGRMLRHEIDETHDEMLQEMAREDNDLAARVQDLKQEDSELLATWNALHRELNGLCERAERVEPHEAKLDEQVEQFSEKALAFVIDARKNEAALTTWYLEAFNRDRGVGD